MKIDFDFDFSHRHHHISGRNWIALRRPKPASRFEDDDDDDDVLLSDFIINCDAVISAPDDSQLSHPMIKIFKLNWEMLLDGLLLFKILWRLFCNHQHTGSFANFIFADKKLPKITRRSYQPALYS